MNRSPKRLRASAVATGAVIALALTAIPTGAFAAPAAKACENRNNNTIAALLECVSADGVTDHLDAFQAIRVHRGGHPLGRPVYRSRDTQVSRPGCDLGRHRGRVLRPVLPPRVRHDRQRRPVRARDQRRRDRPRGARVLVLDRARQRRRRSFDPRWIDASGCCGPRGHLQLRWRRTRPQPRSRPRDRRRVRVSLNKEAGG